MAYSKDIDKGLTVIGAIVIIVIIAVLITAVFFYFMGNSTAGKNDAIKEILANLLVVGANYLDANNNSYQNFCKSTQVTSLQEAISNKGGSDNVCNCDTLDCAENSQAWCACAQEAGISGKTFCVDSSNYKKESGTPCSVRCYNGACSD